MARATTRRHQVASPALQRSSSGGNSDAGAAGVARISSSRTCISEPDNSPWTFSTHDSVDDHDDCPPAYSCQWSDPWNGYEVKPVVARCETATRAMLQAMGEANVQPRRRSLQFHPGRPNPKKEARKQRPAPGEVTTSGVGNHHHLRGGDFLPAEATGSCITGGTPGRSVTVTGRTPYSHYDGSQGTGSRRTLADVVALCEKLLSC